MLAGKYLKAKIHIHIHIYEESKNERRQQLRERDRQRNTESCKYPSQRSLMGSVEGDASSKYNPPHTHHGDILPGEECLKGLAGQGPVLHDVTIVQSKYG